MKSNLTKGFGFGAIIIGLALSGVGLWLLLSPARYRAVVQVRFGQANPGDYDPYFIQTEFQKVKSDLVLSNVVEKLDLSDEWDGQKVGMATAIHRLKKQTTMQSVGSFTYVLEIRVTDKNPETATRVANAIAQAYLDYREKQHFENLRLGVKALQDLYQKEEGDLDAKQMKVELLRRQLNLTNPEPDESVLASNHPSYFQVWRALTNEEAFQKEVKQKIAQEETFTNSGSGSNTMVNMSIISPAVPSNAPIGPNRALGMVLLIGGVAISAFGFYLLSGTVSTTRAKP